jgi:uncharacterized cysteine cluster protein YcgN (CxxCxxCC family)
MRTKIQNVADTLCDTCSHGCTIKGDNENERLVFCSNVQRMMRFQVKHCNDYDNRNSVHLYDMRAIAWTLELDEKKHQIGFRPPRHDEAL